MLDKLKSLAFEKAQMADKIGVVASVLNKFRFEDQCLAVEIEMCAKACVVSMLNELKLENQRKLKVEDQRLAIAKAEMSANVVSMLKPEDLRLEKAWMSANASGVVSMLAELKSFVGQEIEMSAKARIRLVRWRLE